jgi:hypothetical protein
VGAGKLSKDAEDLEMAGKAQDISFIQKNHDNLMNELRGFKEPLEKYYEKNPVKADEAEDDAAAAQEDHSVSNEDLGEILIKSMYTAIEAGAKEKNKEFLSKTFKEMEDFSFAEQHVQTITKLRNCFEKEDYEAMENILKEIK